MVMKMTYFEYIWVLIFFVFFFSSRRRHTRSKRDWSSDVCSSDLGHAPLSRAAKRRAHDGAQRRIRIGVRHDEQDVLGAAARLHPFPVLAAERVDMAGRARGADETDRGDACMGAERVHRVLAAMYNIEYAVGQAGILEDLREPAGREGHLL